MRGGYSTDYPTPDPAYTSDGNWQNGGHRTPDSGHRLKSKTSGSSAGGVGPGNWDNESRKSSERNRSRQRNGRTASGQLRICKKCDKTLTGQFVRALDGTFHLECFKCRVWLSPPDPQLRQSTQHHWSMNKGAHLTLLSVGLRRGRCVEILPSRRRKRRGPVSSLRDGLLPKTRSIVLSVWRGPSRIIHHSVGPQVPCRPLYLFPLRYGIRRSGQLLRA